MLSPSTPTSSSVHLRSSLPSCRTVDFAVVHAVSMIYAVTLHVAYFSGSTFCRVPVKTNASQCCYNAKLYCFRHSYCIIESSKMLLWPASPSPRCSWSMTSLSTSS